MNVGGMGREGGELMQVETSEKYLKAETVRDLKPGSVKILNEGELENGQYGQKLVLKVLALGQKYKWSLNNTNKDALIKLYGKETAEWIGKEPKITTKMQDNGKIGIILDPAQF